MFQFSKKFLGSLKKAWRSTRVETSPKGIVWGEIKNTRVYQRTKLYEKLLGRHGESIFPQDYSMYGINEEGKGWYPDESSAAIEREKIEEEGVSSSEQAKNRRKLSRLMSLRDAVLILQLKEASEDAIQERYNILVASNSYKGGSKYVYDKIYHAKIVCDEALKKGTLEHVIK